MTKLADAQSRRTIEERLDINILVEAGAGSGKTHSLANRMAAGIVSGRYEVEHMAAVTFTRKAAAELRGRFQLALEEKLPQANDEERERIQAALSGLQHLFTGTIHSFCAHLIRERPVEAGIAPGFTELEETENDEARERSWRDYLARLRATGSPLLEELQRARVSAKDLDGAFRTVCTFDEVEFSPGDAREPDAAAGRKAAAAFWRKLQALMPKPATPGAKCEALKRAQKFGWLLRRAESGRPADLVEALRCWEKPPVVTMKWWADDRAQQRMLRQKVEELTADFQAATVVPFIAAWRPYVYRLAMTLLGGAREFARDERRRALTLNYADLLSAAAALLRENPPVRAAMQRKYRWLLVDEFQDTDPVQAEVILLLAAAERDQAGRDQSGIVRDPYALYLRPGALFVVGDPKQSIYRFRRADIDIYTRVRETIRTGGGEVVTLTTSFRARPSLCAWNNDVFRQLLPGVNTVHQAAFTPVDPYPGWKPRRKAPKDETGVFTLTAPEEVAEAGVPAWEADAIARFIRAEIDAGKAAASDYLVLTRKKDELGTYAAALEAQRIPAEVSGAGAFGGSPVVLALVDLLRALGDPGDALAAVSVLRGRLFGISDRQLFAHRQAGGYFGVSAARTAEPREPVRGDEQVVRALERLGGYLRLTRTLPLAAAVEQIVENCGFLALAACDDASAAGDVLRLVDLVREVAERGGSAADAADALEQAAASSEIESMPLEPGRDDVVRVMNLHKAKGLEATVVFLVDPTGAPKKRADVRIVRHGGKARGYLAITKKVGEYGKETIAFPENWEEHQAKELEYIQAEETRLLYVAATRAREMLVVSRWEGKARGARPWQPLEDWLAGAELDVPAAAKTVKAVAPDVSPAARTRAAGVRVRRREAASAPSWVVTSPTTQKADLSADLSAEARRAEGEARRAEAEARRAEGGKADSGAAWGSLVHGLLEHAGCRASTTRDDLRRLARWLVVENPELEPFIDEALDLVARVLATPEWVEARAVGEVYVEVPFAVALERGQELAGIGPVEVKTIVRGVIDLAYLGSDGWRIVDYKTDIDTSKEALARHAPQLAVYREAWKRATGEPVASADVLSAR